MSGIVRKFIKKTLNTAATSFHPFGGTVDIIVVKQKDGTFRSTPWYVQVGKCQGLLGTKIRIEVNGVEANFHMYIDRSGEGYFVNEGSIDGSPDMDRLSRVDSDSDQIYDEFQDAQSSLVDEFSEDEVESENSNSNLEVVLVSVDGHMIKASISSDDRSTEGLQLHTHRFHLFGEHSEQDTRDHDGSDSNNQESREQVEESPVSAGRLKGDHVETHTAVEISLCGKSIHAGMGSTEAEEVFNANRVSLDAFKASATSIVKNENLTVRVKGKYLPWDKAEHIVLGMAAFGLHLPVKSQDAIPVEQEDDSGVTSTPRRSWGVRWPFGKAEVVSDSDSVSVSTLKAHSVTECPGKKVRTTNMVTTDQIASLNLKEGQNVVHFIFSTPVFGLQKFEAHIYLWKWDTRIVISDVDGTITKSDVLGQFMPLVGKDWTHTGTAPLFSAIKENGYEVLFLSARAIVQSCLTKSLLNNIKQDGKSLPDGPVVTSPDGIFPSLYREVIRRTPHEFKIACLEDIKALFPPDYNPFYAGFGNRDTDELSYQKIGIPEGNIFIINPKGEVAINRRTDVKSYTSLHTLVNDMFPPTSLIEKEDYNSWNYWRMPLPDIDNL